jgi:TIR domain
MAEPIPATSGRIFVSYRREETAYPAGWLYDRLADRFGAGQVFKDVDSIQLGDDFVDAITRAVGSCDVLLALIGDQWLTLSDSQGKRRIDDPDDFVRLEIEAALSRNVRVIPILVDGAEMPSHDELPDSLATLVRRQALELSPSRFEFDTSRLFKVLDLTMADVRTEQDDAATKQAQVGEAPGSTAKQAQRTAPPDVAQTVASSGGPPGGLSRPGEAGPVSDRDKPPEKQRRRLSTRAWVLVGVGAGIVLIVAILAASLRVFAPPVDTAGNGGIYVDSTPITSPDDIELTELAAVSSRDPDPPQVGDTVTVSYSLTNVGNQPVRLAVAFVGVRDPSDGNRDIETISEETTLDPGDTITAQGRVLLDAAGTWELWPCYEIGGGNQCPDEWQVFSVEPN